MGSLVFRMLFVPYFDNSLQNTYIYTEITWLRVRLF